MYVFFVCFLIQVRIIHSLGAMRLVLRYVSIHTAFARDISKTMNNLILVQCFNAVDPRHDQSL